MCSTSSVTLNLLSAEANGSITTTSTKHYVVLNVLVHILQVLNYSKEVYTVAL